MTSDARKLDLWSALPTRVLGTAELKSLVDALAERPDLWRDQVGFDDSRRHFVSLHRDEHVDVWLLCWTDRNDTGWHDHDISSVAYHVVSGAVCEANLQIGGGHRQTLLGPGSSVAFGPAHIHRVTGVADRSVTLHAYSPPLWRLGQYTIGADGVLSRETVSYADELRPVDDGPPVPLPGRRTGPVRTTRRAGNG